MKVRYDMKMIYETADVVLEYISSDFIKTLL